MTEYALRHDRKFQDTGFSMSRHSALCRDSGGRALHRSQAMCAQ